MKFHQSHGGRADSYLFESWYDGPFTMVPETTPYTMTYTVRQALLYLKGIGESLDLSIAGAGSGAIGAGVVQSGFGGPQRLESKLSTGQTASYTVALKNIGDVECLPVLKLARAGETSFVVSATMGTTDVSQALASDEGLALTGFLAPGATATLSLKIARASAPAGSMSTIGVFAVWNPQDPTGQIRDMVEVALAAQ